jgi:hypothetical protein
MTHDYKRHGTTTLFAALNVATGEVYHDCLTLDLEKGDFCVACRQAIRDDTGEDVVPSATFNATDGELTPEPSGSKEGAQRRY